MLYRDNLEPQDPHDEPASSCLKWYVQKNHGSLRKGKLKMTRKNLSFTVVRTIPIRRSLSLRVWYRASMRRFRLRFRKGGNGAEFPLRASCHSSPRWSRWSAAYSDRWCFFTAGFSCDNFKYYWNRVLQDIYPHMQLPSCCSVTVEVPTAVPAGFSSKSWSNFPKTSILT